MPLPTLITDLSTTAASNWPAGSDTPATLDDTQRAHAAFIAQLRDGTGFTAGSVTQAEQKIKTTVALADAAAVLTGAQLVSSGIFTITPTVARILTTDTATAIVAALPRYQAGTWFDFTVVNNAAFDVTIAAGVGVTLVGKMIANNASGTWKARIDSATAVTISSTALSAVAAVNLTGHVTSVGAAAVLGSFTLAQLNTAISDADVQPLDAALTALAAGSDFVQFTGPTTSTKVFTLPDASSTLLFSGGALGTPSGGTATNLTGTAASLTAGNVTTNANLTGHVTSTGNAAVLGSFTVAQLNTAVSDADLAILGANTFTGAQIGTVTALTSTAASIAINLATNNNFSHTTSENTTLAAPSNPVAGQSGVITITQGATARTLAYNTFWKFAGGTVPTLTATVGAVDMFAYQVESATRATAQLIKDVK